MADRSMDVSSSFVDIPDLLTSSIQDTTKDHSSVIPEHLLNVQPTHTDGSELLNSITTTQQQCELSHPPTTPPPLEPHNDSGEQMISDLLVQSTFNTALLPSAEPLLTSSQVKLNNLFEDEMKKFNNISDDHWKYPEYPLARIKKIMKMDEDVRMISGEVPILLSKAIEIFVTELTLRSWIYTEETKRRTIQRSDIAMAIAKNDMFDFLIDIVPREEIHAKNNKVKDTLPSLSLNQSGGEAGENSGLINLNPDNLLQAYIQLLTQQSEEEGATALHNNNNKEGEEDPTQNVANLAATSQLMQQQLQLLQQLAAHSQSHQQIHEEQPQTLLVPPPPLSSTNTPTITNTLTHHHIPSNVVYTNTTVNTPGTTSLIPDDQFATHHEHSTTDIVTLLSSKSIDQLPSSNNDNNDDNSTSQYLTSSASDGSFSLLRNDSVERVIIHQTEGEGGGVNAAITNTDQQQQHHQLLAYQNPLNERITFSSHNHL